MRNDQKYLEIINRNDQVEMTVFTAGYMAAMEVNHQYCSVQDSDFSSRILQSCVIERILAEIKMDEQQRRKMGKMVLNHSRIMGCTDHPEFNCENVKLDDSGNEVDEETSPKRDPRFYRTPDGRSVDTHDKSVQVVTDIAVKAMGTMLQSFAKAYGRSAANIAMSMDNYNIDKAKLRGMIYDAERVDDYGNEVDETGTPVPSESHRPWPFYGYRNRITGEFISREDYDKLDTQERIGYYKVKYLEASLDGEVKTLYEDADVQVINNLFEALVQVGDPAEQALYQKYGKTEADGQSGYRPHDCMCKGDIFNNKQTCGACAQCQCGNEGSVDNKGIATL